MKWTRICSALIVLGAIACSSDDKGTTGGGGGEKEAATISADEGGKLEVGEGTLEIPGGSLSEDLEVTVETVSPPADTPERDTVVGLIYDFGPDGTTFDPPATLELPLDRTPGENQVAVVSWLDEDANAWVDLESDVSGGMVSAPIAHFTKFVVRLKDADAGPVDCSFSACGGDLEGEWVIQSACGDTGTNQNPFGDSCPDATFDVGLDASGSVKFGGDGSFEVTLTGQGRIAVEIPSECLAQASFPFPDCSALGDALSGDGDPLACTGDKSTGCTCSGNGGDAVNEHQTGTYTVSGDTFTTETTDDAGVAKSGDAAEYCVTGSTLKVKTSEGTIIQAKKK